MTTFVLIVFAAVYLGMAIGRWPGLKVDRTGIALLGAILLYALDAVDGPAVLAAIDVPTIIVLFGLMILSAQFAVCGFYDCARTGSRPRPHRPRPCSRSRSRPRACSRSRSRPRACSRRCSRTTSSCSR